MARQDVKDEVIYVRAAGLDLGKRFLVACVRPPATSRAGTWSLETERFETTAAEIRRLLAWLLERRVEVVVLEATSDYWRHLYYTLQPQLNLMLVNPAHLMGGSPGSVSTALPETCTGNGACQPVNDVGKPCAGELHARFEAAGTGNGASATAPVPDPTERSFTRRSWSVSAAWRRSSPRPPRGRH